MLWRSTRCCPSSESRSHWQGWTRARGASAGLGSPSRRSSHRQHRPCSTLLLRHFVSDKTGMPTVRLYLMNDAARRLAGRSITHRASDSAPCINFLACCFYWPLLQRDCSTGEFTQAGGDSRDCAPDYSASLVQLWHVLSTLYEILSTCYPQECCKFNPSFRIGWTTPKWCCNGDCDCGRLWTQQPLEINS